MVIYNPRFRISIRMIIDTINSQREVTAEEAVQWKFYTPNENFMHH